MYIEKTVTNDTWVVVKSINIGAGTGNFYEKNSWDVPQR
jgi:hypothetical protein